MFTGVFFSVRRSDETEITGGIQIEDHWNTIKTKLSQMGKGLNEFGANVAKNIWAVEDFSMTPDPTAETATCWCGFHCAILHAHHPRLNMKGNFEVHLANVENSYSAIYKGVYKYVGRGQHRDCCSANCELFSFQHSGCEICNDDQLPDKLSLCMKISTPCDTDQFASLCDKCLGKYMR